MSQGNGLAPQAELAAFLSSADGVLDAVVVGAGPAGALTALHLSRMGKRVALLDRQSFPRWKVCGATVSVGAQELLRREGLGGIFEASGAPPLTTLRLGGWGIRADLPLNGTRALSRTLLDDALVRAAVREGTLFLPGARVRLGDLLPDRRILEIRTPEVTFLLSARAVIAADGLPSSLMAQAGEPSVATKEGKRSLIGLGAVFPPSPSDFEAGFVHMAVGLEGYVGVVRVEDGSLNVAAALDPSAVRESDSPREVVSSLLGAGGWPDLPDHPEGGWKGTPELTRNPFRPGAERLFAVGDAAGYVEPFTGEGILWALQGAMALAPLVARVEESWAPSLTDHWTRAHRRVVRNAQYICRLASWTLARPSIARSTLRALRWNPRLAAPLVRHVGVPIQSLS